MEWPSPRKEEGDEAEQRLYIGPAGVFALWKFNKEDMENARTFSLVEGKTALQVPRDTWGYRPTTPKSTYRLNVKRQRERGDFKTIRIHEREFPVD